MGALVRDASVSARLSPPASIWALALPEGAGERQVAWVNAVQPVWEHHRGASSHHRSAWWTWVALTVRVGQTVGSASVGEG